MVIGNPVWGPFYIQDQKIVESIQQRATRLVPGIRHLTYADRLSILNVPPLLYRRKRGDMITLYQIFHGLVDLKLSDFSHCPAIHLLGVIQGSYINLDPPAVLAQNFFQLV